MAEMTVRVEGTVTTAGTTGGTAAAPSFVSVSQGGQTANIAVPGPNLGAGLVVTTGALVSSKALTGASATGPGAVADFGSAKTNLTIAITANVGVSAGAVALEVSQDNTNWFRGTPVTQSAPGVTSATITGAWRYARGNVTTIMTGGTVDASLMAS